MNTLNFLQRVLPSEGIYVATTIEKDGRTQQGYFSTVEDLATAVAHLSERGKNTYYAISAFAEKGSRKQDNVRATKVLALDVDCGGGKPYPTWKEGLVALGVFVAALQLPKPMVVFSGNGLHVYWVLSRELEPEQWKPLAEALKAATLAHDFKTDAGLTANSALVLRPTGTTNPKNGKTVSLLVDAPFTTPEELAACLNVGIIPKPGARSSALTEALAVKQELPPAVAGVVASKCQQINWAVNNQSEVSEPLWYDLIGVAAFCEDSEDTAIAWSENHPDYNPKETLSKLKQWQRSATGPTTCSKFEIDRPRGCDKCKFKGKIGSPTRLGIQYAEIAAPVVDDGVVHDVLMPRPFKRTADGIKMTIDDADIDICSFDIYPVSYGKDETLGYETVRFRWNRPHCGWQDLVLRQAYLTEGHREFATALADQGIVLYNRNQTGYFQLMLRSYMDALRQKRAMTNLYNTMGWKQNYSQFVIGDTVLRRNADGTIDEERITLSSGAQRLGHDLYTTSGTLEQWVDFTTLLSKAHMPAHMFSVAVGLSAPLYAFTGLKGLTISLYGPTGGGKTLAQLWQQSIWGDPDKLHFAAKFTQNTLFSRMGMYCHMPMTIDEVTMMVDREVGDFAYWVSQGRDKARLNRNAEERDSKEWALPVTVSTNKSLHSKLIASKLDTDAQMARILEISVPQHSLLTKDSSAGRKIYHFVTGNFGHAGRAFVTKLLELGPAGVQAAIAEATDDFNRKHKSNFSGEERYWEQAIILADLAGKLATEWGLIKFDHTHGIEWVLSQVGAIRRAVADSKLDNFDLLSDYINDSADSVVTMHHTGTQRPTMDFSRVPRGDVRIRFDLYRKTSGDYFDRGIVLLDRTHFRRWLSSRGADYKTFMQDMQDEGILATPKSGKAYLGKDTNIKLGQCYVVGIKLNHPRLIGILDSADQALEDMAYSQLKLVT
jgi:hypothetical protein